MAILESGITGPFIGRVGPVVGYRWKGLSCVRSYVPHIRYPNTEAQQRERDWFVGMVRFAAAARPALRLGLRDKAARQGMTEGNLFVSVNKQFFVRTEGQVTVDYASLLLASGPAADVYFREARFGEHETVSVPFEKNALSLRASGDDGVYLYAYAPEAGEGCLSAPAPRRSKSVSVSLPRWWSGMEVHLYGFVVDKEGRPSNSTYIGVGRVNHYEDRGRYIPLNKNWNDFVDMANEVNASHEGDAGDAEPLPESRGGGGTGVGDPPEVP